MYKELKDALEAMIAMAEDCECVVQMGTSGTMQELDEDNRYMVEIDDDDSYKVTVCCDGKTCSAELTDEKARMLEGSEEDFKALCEEFTLAW